jgi:hypothetical protein
MAQHVLSLEAPDTLNKSILRVVDTSIYNPMIPITCPLLQITPPGFAVPTEFKDGAITPGFIFNLTGCDLGIQISGCGTSYVDLQDGIYIIKYSVSPNEIVYVEYNHLRITGALWKYYNLLCDLDVAACDPPASVKDKLRQLNLIRMYLDAAKSLVEFCHEPKKGMDIFNYAVRLLDKMDCKTC